MDLRPVHHLGVGGIDPLYICIDPARVRADGCGQRHGGGVRTSPADGGDVTAVIQALESGHHGYLSLGQGGLHALGIHFEDPGVPVMGSGMYPRLPAAQGQGRTAQFLQLHGHQRHGHLLAAGKQHVFFPGVGRGRDLPCFFDQFIGGIPLGGHHHRHLVPRRPLPGNQLGRPADVRRGSQGRAAEFHHDAHFASLHFFAATVYGGGGWSVPRENPAHFASFR